MAKYLDDPSLFFQRIVDDSEGEEEEALSLSGLPVELGHNDRPCQDDDGFPLDGSESGSDSEFEFGLGSVEMRAADDLFFQGRILPLLCDHSGAPSSLNKSLGKSPGFSTVEPVSRSDSMESGSTGQVLSTSSRSSSKGSQHSSSGSTSSTSTSFDLSRVTYHSSSSASYLFGSCQSPSPQTGFPGSNKTALIQGNKIRSKSHRSYASSLSSPSVMWEFFRPGLVRTRDIELHNLKIRRGNNSNNNNNNNSCDDYDHEGQGKKNKKKGMRGFELLGGCKCTADSVATNLVLLRSDSNRIRRSRRKSNVGSGEEEELRRKLMELIEIDDSRMKKKPKAKKEVMAVEKNHRDHDHRVSSSSSSRHRRTFEWVKELPRTAAGGSGYYDLHQ